MNLWKPTVLLAGFGLVATLAAPRAALADDFSVSSADWAEGKQIASEHVFEGFGCTGGNQSPQLTWKGAPEGTKSFAVSIYDPDAPTGSGWWHWITYDLSASTRSLKTGASAKMPKGATTARNDYGAKGFGGPCPPAGEVHRYVVTVFALDVPKLETCVLCPN